MQYDVIVIGAGQACLAAAYALSRAGLRYRVLEAGERAVGSWPSYYDSLKLFSPARFSGLAGRPFPGDPDRYRARDEVVAYLEDYARHFAFPIEYRARVTRISREDYGFIVTAANEQQWRSTAVIVASGAFNQPNRPAFVGLEQFQGQVLHSSEYRRQDDIQGSRVAVIGAGNSAVQIAYELSASREVVLVSKQPPAFREQRPWGRDLHFWLKWSGLDTMPYASWLGFDSTTPVLDTGIYRQAFADKRLRQLPMFDCVTSRGLQ